MVIGDEPFSTAFQKTVAPSGFVTISKVVVGSGDFEAVVKSKKTRIANTRPEKTTQVFGF